ncbi:MAG: ABC transporter substrate-binding protein [Eubacteriales bacterium]|nr:ABC transporter substrate-binding protein [Eubacteriales bacterium]
MKKLLASMLALVMLFGMLALAAPVLAEEAELEEPEQIMTDADTLVVGAPELNADYINGFGNSSYDVYIKYLLGTYGGEAGYATYFSDEAGQFILNPTVTSKEPEVTEHEDGSKTYTFFLAEDLKWNDGEPVTALDYVFTNFFLASPEWMAQGANNSMTGEDYVGFDAYHAGETRVFEGVKLIDDYTFSVTLKADKLPYFYETAIAASVPTPIHRYAPSLTVVDNELVVKEGYEVTEEDKASIVENAGYKVTEAQAALDEEQAWWEDYQAQQAEAAGEDAEVEEGGLPGIPAADVADEEDYLAKLQKAVDDAQQYVADLESGAIEMDPLESLMTEAALDVAYNFRFKPDVTCGPYQFVEYANRMAKVTLNPEHKGDRNGKLPVIKNIIVQTVNSALDMDFIIAGYIDLVPGFTEAAKINKGKDNPDKVAFTNYPRNGYGLLAIRNDYSPTQYPGVRKAIAYSIDRDEFVTTISGGYGLVVDGCFGIDQFEYVDRGEEIESHEDWVHYTLNADQANEALDTTPYIFEADGVTPWDPAKAQDAYDNDKENFDYWRYDENGNELRIVHYGATGIETTNLIQVMLPDNAKRVGMNYIVNPVDFATLLDVYYGDAPEDTTNVASCFNMGTGFAIPDDKYYSYHSSQIGVGSNNDRVNSPELDEIIDTMRRADPTDVDTWEDGWVKFQLWYNANLPNIPLYANDYHTFFTVRVQGHDATPMWDWYNDIYDMYLE